MSRKKRFLLNTATGLIKQIVTVICGFILPRYMLKYYGSTVNGLVSSLTHFLGFISLLDMGVGSVIHANLYKPLAEKDKNRISEVVKASERFFRKLGCIFLAYIGILCFIIPDIVEGPFSTWYTISLLIIISISTFAQYLFGMTYQLLLNADQKSYVHLSIQIVTVILNTVLAIILIQCGASIHIVKLMSASLFVFRPIVQMLYVHKHYDIDHSIKIIGEPIKQKWNGFSQHMAAVVCNNVDVVTLTLFSTLENVSIYSVYYNITNGIEQVVLTAATGLESLFGNMISKGEKEKLHETFCTVEWITHAGVTIVFTVAALTIVPFISVYTRGITDANYITPVFGSLLVIAYGSQCLRVPYFRLIKAAGHFKETQNGAYISAGLNILITIALVFRYGLIGAAIGTLVAMSYHTCYFVWYLRKNIINRSVKHFVVYMIIDSFVAIISYLLTKGLIANCSSYGEWVILTVKVLLIVLTVSAVVHIVTSRAQIKKMVRLLKKDDKKRRTR